MGKNATIGGALNATHVGDFGGRAQKCEGLSNVPGYQFNVGDRLKHYVIVDLIGGMVHGIVGQHGVALSALHNKRTQFN